MKRHSKGSNHRQKRARHIDWFLVVGGSLTVFLIAAICVGTFSSWKQRLYPEPLSSWPSASGQVLGRRIDATGTSEQWYGPGIIYYRAKVLVRFRSHDHTVEQWLPVYHRDSNRFDIQLWLASKKSPRCTIHWNPHNPNDVRVTLY